MKYYLVTFESKHQHWIGAFDIAGARNVAEGLIRNHRWSPSKRLNHHRRAGNAKPRFLAKKIFYTFL